MSACVSEQLITNYVADIVSSEIRYYEHLSRIESCYMYVIIVKAVTTNIYHESKARVSGWVREQLITNLF